MVFFLIGAWPVFGFFGLDVALIYYAFKLQLPVGQALRDDHAVARSFEADARASVGEAARSSISIPIGRACASRSISRTGGRRCGLSRKGKEVLFGQFLTDDERRDFANALTGALVARGARF